MVHYVTELSLSERLRENMRNGDDDLMFVVLECNLADYSNNCATWHWHEYAELAFVIGGVVECCTQNHTLALHPGEGYYLSGNVLHMNRMAFGCKEARLRVIQFNTALLSGSGTIAQRYVRPLERRTGMDMLRLTPGELRHDDALKDMAALFDAAAAEPPGYELLVYQRLFHLWRTLYEITLPTPDTPALSDDGQDRVKEMLAFVHTRFADNITVADIAGAANISEREAYRTFRAVLNTTPVLYLTRHRINHSARLLRETTLPITEVAMASGFSTPNYFCKVFHDLMGMSPRSFRQSEAAG